ncbi:hypothetical protein [Xanthomonas prunicola]|uniref:hypothetical protein n=1 Tax=Xanthomonas prunicola TaxID=2053930 RepID=UPI001054C2AE|nr:hypothetical protein [Xanthomonas prunicola]
MNTTEIQAGKILRRLLQSGPEKAARLKQRLIAEYALAGLGRFDEKAMGYKKFKDFLERSQGGLASISTAEGGDIIVSLNPKAVVEPSTPIQQRKSVVIRSDVWQAFLNQDASRKRFLNKDSFDVVHFKTDGENFLAPDPSKFLEILPLSKDILKKWMLEFLRDTRIAEDHRLILDEMLNNAEYSSALNLTFTQALGENAPQWKSFRIERVYQEISQWSAANGIDAAHLLVQQKQWTTDSQAEKISHVREHIFKLLEITSDADLEKIVLPILVATSLIRTRT